MRKRSFSWACMMGLYLAWPHTALSLGGDYVGFHQDYRTTPKLITNVKHKSLVGGDALDIAKAYLKESTHKFDWNESHLELMTVKESLTGTHVHFRQMRDGYPVRFGEVIVSVDTKTQTVFQVFNNFYSGKDGLLQKKQKASLSKDAAFDIAWQDLKVHGKLQSQPQADLMYVVSEDGLFTLAYVTNLNVEAPFGVWEHVIDATNGKIISTRDTRLERKRSDMAAMRDMYKGPVTDRNAAFKAFQQERLQKKKSRAHTLRADGSGLVFDPDPRTTLNDGSLKDSSPAERFDDAYFVRELRDLTIVDGEYTLSGPWVTIADFESPRVPPSTTEDGVWSSRRGNVAFNDVMTYFHIDQNQRYMQSLGFTGDKLIQGASIRVDANGLGGADNSHYIPSTNSMAFGHGCVDDNEDADVILHEYGHAINYSINSNWGGGDAGAMGEGFGDYWAGSYSYSTANGKDYEPNNVFNWDGHGDDKECWPGRTLNALDLEYDHSRTYGAHSPLPGNRQTDELWSTPLFQTLIALTDQGIPREDVDQIILEGQFGLGSGLKMRDLANAVISAAHRLQPNGPHAEVFFEKFAHHGIVTAPQAALSASDIQIVGTGNNGVVDPGETISLNIGVQNLGTLAATSVEGRLTAATPLVTIPNSTSAYPRVDVGATAFNQHPFSFAVDPAFTCGDKIELDMELTFEGGPNRSEIIPVSITTGVPEGASAANSTEMAIPDNDADGVTSSMHVDVNALVTANLMIDVNIEHTYIGDLKVVLTSPSGTEITLHNRLGGSKDNIVGTYGSTLEPAEPLSALAGEPLDGVWTLRISDNANLDTGSLISWGLRDITGYRCE